MSGSRALALLIVLVVCLSGGCRRGRPPGSSHTKKPSTAKVTPQATPFCSPGSGDLACEDFTSVAEGALPNGWLGGEGLLVKSSDRLRGKPVLTPFEPRSGYLIQIPWALKGDFRLEMHVLPCAAEWECGHDTNGFTIRMGALEATIGNLRGTFGDCGVKMALGNSEAPIPGSDACGFDNLFHVVAIERSGNVWKFSYDGAPGVVARYDVPVPEAIVLSSTERGFTLAGIRVRALTKEVPSAANAALSCPTACKDDEICSGGKCTRLCPFSEGALEPIGSHNNERVFREFVRTEPGCEGGPCVWDFGRATGISLETLEPLMARSGCIRRAGGQACCPSPLAKTVVPSSSPPESNDVFKSCSIETDAMTLLVVLKNGMFEGGSWTSPKTQEYGSVRVKDKADQKPIPEGAWVDLVAGGDDVVSNPKLRVRVTGSKMDVEGQTVVGTCE